MDNNSEQPFSESSKKEEPRNEPSELPIGTIMKAKLSFEHVDTKETLDQPNPRPVVVIKDYGDGAVKVATLTSRIEKRHVKEFGHTLDKTEEYGLNKPSAVLCTNANRGIIPREKLSGPYGRLPFSEMEKIFKKIQQVNQKEHGLKMKLISELER